MQVNIRHPSHRKVIFFSHDELACKKTGEVILAEGFADELALLRIAFNRRMVVNSCCRSAEHNRTMMPKGHPRSLHVHDEQHVYNDSRYHDFSGCAAIDIRTPDIVYARQLVDIALRRGWSVGVAKHFIHLDRRDYAGLEAGVFGYG
jgi:hypothetical protein|tara:strand:- start:2911 stop:3351 length:441 start_codon:yes stop_codon:yes gene_type:complete